MFLLDGRVVTSASDLTLASRCEFAVVRAVDVVLGRVDPPELVEDPMLAYTARLGDEHEAAVLQSFRERFGRWDPTSGRGVYEVEPPMVRSRASLLKARAETLEALDAGADVVFQASFFDGSFHGRADFLVRDGDRYAVVDSKLARRAKVQALLQVAAYADQLAVAGHPPAPIARLILGDRTEAEYALADLVPVFRERRDRLAVTIAERVADPAPAEWGDPRYTACGRCPVCDAEVTAHRDVLGVARLSVRHQIRLREAGITTIDELAASTQPVAGIPERVLDGFRTQARLQVRQDPPDGGPGEAGVELVDPDVVAALPPPDPGDLFFDFEGDPLWAGDGPTDWGIEYLFGVVEAPETSDGGPIYRYWWADDRAQEKEALMAFLDYVEKRRVRHPGMHIYHYAAYEKTALLALAGRHGVGEDAVDALLRAGVLVDLYAAVRAGIRVSQRSYSIKKLEPFYMGDELRDSDVTSGGASVVAYDTYTRLRVAGDRTGAQRLRGELLDYNRYDCVSTLRLRDWLLAMLPPSPAPAPLVPEPPIPEPTASRDDEPTGLSVPPFEQGLVDSLNAAAGSRDRRGADEQAAAMLAAAIGYHRREEKPFWWAHYDRLSAPVDEWAGGRDVFVVEGGRITEPWRRGRGQRKDRRGLDLVGRLAVGSSLSQGASVFGVYDPPVPRGARVRPGSIRGTVDGITVTATDVDASGHDIVRVEQIVRDGLVDHPALPIALTPTPPPKTTSIHEAIVGVAERVVDALERDVALADALPRTAAVDLLRRVPPRVAGGLPPVVDDDDTGAITAALLGMESSYVAVQGPPGTGKTYVGARVIARLVTEHHWRVGVVAQSHAAIENMLEAVVTAGVPADRVAKKPHVARGAWTPIRENDIAGFLEAHRHSGAVFGGTMWDLTHPGRVVAGCLDLVVVDEAGQYSLANTVGVATAGHRLLLLGDPQQLPQVSQGTHPEPVDDSALGWLTEGHGALPPQYGYFLRRTWRMHSALTERVSRLAYDGRLRSEVAVTDARSLDGVPPGVQVVTVPHRGNSVQSEEEAAEVVAQVRAHLGLRWTDPGDPTAAGGRPLTPSDVMVVAPYNAQVGLIRQHLRDAGLVDVPVGTVDRFQGRQAPVVIMSMTASSAADAPRGAGFLFSRHRMNVAVSRGQWRAVIIRSDTLTEVMPRTTDQLTDLGAFIALCT